MEYNIKYRYDSERNGVIHDKSLIKKPKKIEWNFQNEYFDLESKLEFKTVLTENGSTKVVVANSVYDYISSVYLSSDFILVLYSDDDKHNKIFPSPRNLVLYNLKKEVIKTILPPKPIHINFDVPIYAIGEIKKIDNIDHITVYMGIGNSADGVIEIRYLNLETFEFHPTENKYMETHDQR